MRCSGAERSEAKRSVAKRIEAWRSEAEFGVLLGGWGGLEGQGFWPSGAKRSWGDIGGMLEL